MRFIVLGCFSLLVSACASMLPVEQRQFEISRPISVNETSAYKTAMQYLARNMGNAKESIRYSDEATKTIVVPMNVSCKGLDQPLDPNDYSVSALAEISFKEKNANFLFTNMTTITAWGSDAGNNAQMVSEDSLNAGKRCLYDGIASPMLKRINQK